MKLHRHPRVGRVERMCNDTSIERSGAVRSVQEALITLPAFALDSIWSPMHLERLARTYWRFISRITLGLIHVVYEPNARYIVLLGRPLTLLAFGAPEYELNGDRGVVRWRIKRGLLVSRRGRDGKGHLEIVVRREPSSEPGMAAATISVEVASFYPALASGIGAWFYKLTQSRIHVIVTSSFLRSLTRLDLAESRVGKFS